MEDILAFLGSNVFNSYNSYRKCANLKPTIENNQFSKLQTTNCPPPCLYLQVEEDTAPPLYISDRNLEKSNRLQSAVP